MTEADCIKLGVEKRGPKRSDHWLCAIFIWGWLFAHPKDGCSTWFIIRVSGECDECGERHPEKEYARQFNRFRSILIHSQRVATQVCPRFRIFSVE
jgi:hypothetical protein